MNGMKCFLSSVYLSAFVLIVSAVAARGQKLPAPQPIPVPTQEYAPNSLTMQDPSTFPEVKMDFPMAPGPFKPTWESINANYPDKANWLREAKFGIWVHFGPQAAGESGDWYARRIYQPGSNAYNNHMRDYGHPSETGYIDVIHKWNPQRLDPVRLAHLYKEAGARFLLVQGVHHDNFDNWNSKYQPWNSVNMGPHRDLLGEWSKAARQEGIRFGVAFHHEYTWWWWQPSFSSDTTGPKAGVPYDGHLTPADGKGKWWEGYDPRLLYGIDLRAYKTLLETEWQPASGIFDKHLEYAHWYTTRWALRILDVIDKYDPDFIYTDGDSTQPFSGSLTGTGYKCDAAQRVIASYYNRGLTDHGKLDKLAIIKFHNGTHGVVNTFESGYPRDIIRDQDWVGENAVGDWFYSKGFTYDARSLVSYMLEVVSRDGAYAVNIPMRPDGSLDPESEEMLKDVGNWMRINGDGIYGSRAWKVAGEGATDENGKLRGTPRGGLGEAQAKFQYAGNDFRFTQGADGAIYVFVMAQPKPGDRLTIHSFSAKAGLLDQPIRSITLQGSHARLNWKQTDNGVVITIPQKLPTAYVNAFRVELVKAK